MILSFRDTATADFYHGRQTTRVRKFPPEIGPSARRKLDMINAAADLEDLRNLPGNRLEALRAKPRPTYSISLNHQWQIIFHWIDPQIQDVSLTTYHREKGDDKHDP